MEEKEKPELKGRLVKFAGATIVAAALVTGGLAVGDLAIDHTQYVCPFNSILGVEHQVNTVNNKKENWQNGIQARIQTVYTLPNGYILAGTKGERRIPATYSTDGKTGHYIVPEGYVLDLSGDMPMAVQMIDATRIDTLVVTKGDVVYPENVNPENIFQRNEITYENEEVINTLRLK